MSQQSKTFDRKWLVDAVQGVINQQEAETTAILESRPGYRAMVADPEWIKLQARWKRITGQTPEGFHATPAQKDRAINRVKLAIAKLEADYHLWDESTATPQQAAVHSTDFRSVNWFGTPYTFTKSQALCVGALWTAWENGTPELDGVTVVTQAEVAQARLIDVFRSKGKAHPAWGTMIVQGQSKGAYRLSNVATATAPKPRPKQSRKTTRKTPR